MQDSEGRPGEATRPGAASVPAEGLTNGNAAASQSGALNANVSVRVGSPGSDGAVHQGNSATATGRAPTGAWSRSPAARTSTWRSSSPVPPAPPRVPGRGTGSGTALHVAARPGADIAPTAASIWDWMWKAGIAGSASGHRHRRHGTTAGAPPRRPRRTLRTGSWTWNWTWVFADGTSWSLNMKEACECAWDWNWTWDWSKQNPTTAAPTAAPASTTATMTTARRPAVRPAIDDGAVKQTNAVEADATSTVDLATLSEATSRRRAPIRRASSRRLRQTADHQQSAREAQSQAAQSDARNTNITWGVPVESVLQWNEVEADTTPPSTRGSARASSRSRTATARRSRKTAEQWTNNSQVGRPPLSRPGDRAQHQQGDAPSPKKAAVGAVQQSNSASLRGLTSLDADVAQWIGQFQDGGDSKDQVADRGAASRQLAGRRLGLAGLPDPDEQHQRHQRPEGSQATNPTASQRNEAYVTTLAIDKSVVDGWILQAQVASPGASPRTRGRKASSARRTAPPRRPRRPTSRTAPPGPVSSAAVDDRRPGRRQPRRPGDPGNPNPGDPGNPNPGIPATRTPEPRQPEPRRPERRRQPTPVRRRRPPPPRLRGPDSPGTPKTGSPGDRRHERTAGLGPRAATSLRRPTGVTTAARHDHGSNAPNGPGPGAPRPSPDAPRPRRSRPARAPPTQKSEVDHRARKGAPGRSPPPPPGAEDWSDFGATAPAPSSGGGSGVAALALGQYELAVPEVLGRQLPP